MTCGMQNFSSGLYLNEYIFFALFTGSVEIEFTDRSDPSEGEFHADVQPCQKGGPCMYWKYFAIEGPGNESPTSELTCQGPMHCKLLLTL